MKKKLKIQQKSFNYLSTSNNHHHQHHHRQKKYNLKIGSFAGKESIDFKFEQQREKKIIINSTQKLYYFAPQLSTITFFLHYHF